MYDARLKELNELTAAAQVLTTVKKELALAIRQNDGRMMAVFGLKANNRKTEYLEAFQAYTNPFNVNKHVR